MTHSYHLDIASHGLSPGCPRCEEHAEHPERGLDSVNLLRLREGLWFTALDRKAAFNLMDYDRAEQEHLKDATRG